MTPESPARPVALQLARHVTSARMAQLAAFLRGINVGGHRRISMADLRKLLEDAGYAGVRTHLQSGNVVLSSKESPAKVAGAIQQLIETGLGMDVKVVMRTGAELAAVVAENPLAGVATNPKAHLVLFLSAKPSAAALRELAEQDFAPDRFEARGREIYVWCPDGMRDSRLVKSITEKRLGVTITNRNWNTVTKMLEMVQAAD